jgi:hypothetical protein
MENIFINSNSFKRRLTSIIGLFVISPFATLCFAIKNYRASWSKNVVWFYTAFFGYTFTINSTEVDASRYKDTLLLMSNPDFSIKTIFSNYWSDDSGTLDIAQRIITFVVAQFTQDYRMLFAVFGLFLGYFLSRIIWFLIKQSSGKLNVLSTLLLVSYSLVVGIWDIGGIRWNIAALIFFYGAILYIVEGNKKGIIVILSTIFVHWSFPAAIVIFFLYKYLKNQPIIYFILFISSFVLVELNVDFIRNIFELYAPKAVQNSRESYLNEGYIQSIADKRFELAWYISYHVLLLKWLILVMVSYIFLKDSKTIKQNQPELFRIFNFGMFFYGVFNILSTLPSVGRFINIANLILLFVIFVYLQFYGKTFPDILKYLSIPILLLFIIVRLRIGFDYIGIWSVFGSPLYVYFVENNLPLINLIKAIFA